MPCHYITLPNGSQCSLGNYVRAWKTLKTMDPETLVPGFEWYPVPAGSILREMRRGMMQRINQRV